MTGWLEGKRARLMGESAAIAAAMREQGAEMIETGPAEIIVHVAEAPPNCPAHAMSHGEWRAVLEGGLDRRFLAVQTFAEERRKAGEGGAVLFVGAPEQALSSAHAAAAGALGNLTKTLAVEWARDGIRVNTILTTDAGSTLGNLAAYLVSDYAAYVTGAVMGIGIDD
jgi:NAD(P)-dependent dehydrogenase (short-subunit alcohol dehydrogenase family)